MIASQKRDENQPITTGFRPRRRPVGVDAPSSRSTSPEEEDAEPWVHKEGPIILLTPASGESPPQPPLPRIPTLLRPGAGARANRGAIKALPPLLEGEEQPIPAFSSVAVAASVNIVEQQKKKQRQEEERQRYPPPRTSHPSQATSSSMRYYPVALSLPSLDTLNLPIPSPTIAAQFPDDPLRAEIASLRLRVSELEARLTDKEGEKEAALREAEEKWKARVERLEQERDLLVLERLSVGRMEEQRAFRPWSEAGQEGDGESGRGEMVGLVIGS
ncbi:uncharacterized protein AB675_3989 [Cyphellophora attinorum]|uniref:Uncharacterized protein n=1 Tax=Cyphellophora attinorum TaxID=1664694 RepID=A0A0N1H0R5_9EURO|nr:uncharacterized protein AB675_3989 [Phialophora attinorum]KPI37606.1 hypothetical protein AB675_3989 [Phialophora attinorum]